MISSHQRSRFGALRKRATGSGAGVVNILGINSVYHESAAALLVDGELVGVVRKSGAANRTRTCDPVITNYKAWDFC